MYVKFLNKKSFVFRDIDSSSCQSICISPIEFKCENLPHFNGVSTIIFDSNVELPPIIEPNKQFDIVNNDNFRNHIENTPFLNSSILKDCDILNGCKIYVHMHIGVLWYDKQLNANVDYEKTSGFFFNIGLMNEFGIFCMKKRVDSNWFPYFNLSRLLRIDKRNLNPNYKNYSLIHRHLSKFDSKNKKSYEMGYSYMISSSLRHFFENQPIITSRKKT